MRLPKQDFINILRESFLTRAEAEELYSNIHDRIIEKLYEGHEINLFDLAVLAPNRRYRAVMDWESGEMITKPCFEVKPKVHSKLRATWKLLQEGDGE